MTRRMAALLFVGVVTAVLGVAARGHAAPPQSNQASGIGREVTAEEMDVASLTAADRAVLEDRRYKWKHLQTEHFVVHYEQKIFASRVARMGEQFYEAIASDLPNLRDRVSPARSHIFIFRDARDWQTLRAERAGLSEWAASFVVGRTMYLQEVGTSVSDKMEMLAHEMTHLVFNRFLPLRLPLWMNEGLAEYYGEFAYRAARGIGQSKGNSFPPMRKWMPLETVLTAQTYPASRHEVTHFYKASKYVIGFLRLRFSQEQWNTFLDRVLAGTPALTALMETYGWADIAAMEKEFARFAR